MKPEYLVDHCAVLSDEEKKTGKYIPLRHLAKPHVPDHIVLKIGIEKQLIVITSDISMIRMACLTGVNIIFQDEYGEKYYIFGSKTQHIGRTKMKPRTYGNKKTKVMKILAKYQPQKLSAFGIETPVSF